MDGQAPRSVDARRIRSVKRHRAAYLCVSACALLVLGLVYAWSIFAVPLGDAFGWDRSALSYVFSISMISFCVGALAGSFLVRWWSTKVALGVAAALQLSGFVLTALFAEQGIGALYLFYGMFAGFGCGVGYNTVITTVNLWFPDRIGVSAGVLMMGYGLGSLVLGTTVNAAMEAFGWDVAFMAIGCISAVILVSLAAFLRMPPADIEDIVGGARGKKRAVSRKATENRPMLKSPLFYLYFIWAVLLLSTSLTLIGDSKQGALVIGVDPMMATLLVGLVSLANGLARLVIGVVFDRSGLRTAMVFANCVAIVALALLAISFAFTLPGIYYGAALLAGFSGGGGPVMASSFTRERFGARSFPRNLAIVNFSLAFSALVSSLVVTVVRPIGGDVAVYGTLCLAAVLALGVSLIFFRLYYQDTCSGAARSDGAAESTVRRLR